MEQGSPEWLALRAGKLSASQFPQLMATTKTGPGAGYKNLVAAKVVERLTGRCAEIPQTFWMARGIELEPLAREAYEDANMVEVVEVPFVQHPEHDFISCSPDGLVGDDGMVEIKCLTEANHLEALLSGKHAKDYYWQAVGQMWVAGRKWCDLVAYHPDYPENMQLAVVRVEADEEAFSQLKERCLMAQAGIEKKLKQLKDKFGATEA